ncbi:alpha-amylase family glycosyl hydrolase, partial [Flavobacterium sp.]|uniref:alpha-amylase family glycosyl hydrolase n=1 Tax=Flavobacterium sp. TaxID=239 RepID=UPI001B434EF7
MKKLAILALVALSFTNSTSLLAQNNNLPPEGYYLDSSSLENAVIYEVNIRQYSPEGSFNAFTKDIPNLKQLGVKVIWIMPIFPISQTKRKATGGDNSKFASEMPAAEQHKYLGSYYAVSDFKKVNPEFGTLEDFR